MPVRDHVKNAISSLTANKLRSGLSSLGIIIGIFSVVVLLAVGQGAQNKILSNVESLGTNLLTVTPGWTSQTDVRSAGSKSATNVLSLDEAELIKWLPNVKAVSPELSSRKQIVYKENNMQASVYGVAPDYLIVRNSSIAYGSFITQENINNIDKVAVIGSTTASTLFWDEDPIGKDINIGNNILTVIGVMNTKWSQWFWGNVDSTVFIPITSAQQRLLWTKYLSSIALSVTSTDMIDTAKKDIENALMKKFNITDTADENFTISSLADAISTISQITDTMKLFISAIAVISLIVGGIGVMNIMLVSVTERTREIGIRKAIWAQNRDIILQFLGESVALCVLWWVIGIALSYLVILAIQSIIVGVITLWSITMAFSFATAVGIGFGIYPAYQAARLKPIDALRYE